MFLAPIAASFVLAVATSPTPLVPNGSFLRPYTNLWNVTVVKTKFGERVNAGTWSDAGAWVQYNGARAFQRRQVFTIAKTGDRYKTVNVFDPITMRPLMREFSTSRGDDRRVIFDNRNVTVIEKSRGHHAKFSNSTIDGTYFDFSGGMYGLLLAGYPLTAGYSNSLKTIAEKSQRVEEIPFRVVAREPVTAGARKTVMAWRVEANWHDPDPSSIGSVLTFWLTKDPPYIIKLVYDAPSLGISYIYTMA